MRARLVRWRSLRDRAAAQARFEDLVEHVTWIEPTGDEVRLAAELEERALRGGFELDGGESQLAAIMIVRGSPLLLTGDKRAIVALGATASGRVDGRLACLEQLLATMCAVLGPDAVRVSVCAEPSVDRAASIAFSCRGPSGDPAPALSSYVRHLRERSPALANGDGLSAIVLQEHGVWRAQVGDEVDRPG